jgi:predicted MPP superfamily phosphohydrolase
MRRLRWIALILLLIGAGTLLWMFANARAMPVVRRATVDLPYPADAPREPVTVALLTDTHLSGPDNSPERLQRIVAQVNGLQPDIILLGGDYASEYKGGATYGMDASIAPFAALRAPLGVFAVLGNHDLSRHDNRYAWDWQGAFDRIGVTLLRNRVVRRGPLAIGGLDDFPKIGTLTGAMRRDGGAQLLLAHRPDHFPDLPDRPTLMLAGHTHCGQIALPWYGAVFIPAKYGTRFSCGPYLMGKRLMIVSGGIATSGLPLRAFAPPDIWLITIRPSP